MVRIAAGSPNKRDKVLDENGEFTDFWYRFMEQMWKKLGGSQDRLDQATPTGSLSGFGGATAPDGWLLCDGSDVSRIEFENLFNIIGTSYGAGDGSTTFNVPDGQGRALVGAGTGAGLTARSIGDTFGEEDHTLLETELTQHTHTVTDAGHTHDITDPEHTHTITDPEHDHGELTDNFVNDKTPGTEYLNTGGDKGAVVADTATASTGIVIDSAATGITIDSEVTGIVIDDTGSGDAFNVIQPSFVASWIIKT